MEKISKNDLRKVQSLFNATMAGDLEGIKTILAHKIHNIDGDIINESMNIGEIDSKGWGRRPIHVAVIAGHYDILQYLIENGANINKKTKYGDTALHFCVHYNRYKIFMYLLDHGADWTIKNNVNLNTMDLAKEQNKESFIKELEKSRDGKK